MFRVNTAWRQYCHNRPCNNVGVWGSLNSSSSLCEQYHSIITHSSIHLRRTLTLSDEGDPSGAPLFSYLGNGDFGLVGFQWFAGEAQSAIQSSGQVAFIRAAPIVDWIQTTIDFRRRLWWRWRWRWRWWWWWWLVGSLSRCRQIQIASRNVKRNWFDLISPRSFCPSFPSSVCTWIFTWCIPHCLRPYLSASVYTFISTWWIPTMTLAPSVFLSVHPDTGGVFRHWLRLNLSPSVYTYIY